MTPRGQQQHVPIPGLQRGQRTGQLPDLLLCGDLLGRANLMRLRLEPLRSHHPSSGPPTPNLLPHIPPQQVGGDPVQPRPHSSPSRVVGVPLLQRHQERLRDQVVRGLVTDPTSQVAMQRPSVLIEEPPENRPRIRPRQIQAIPERRRLAGAR